MFFGLVQFLESTNSWRQFLVSKLHSSLKKHTRGTFHMNSETVMVASKNVITGKWMQLVTVEDCIEVTHDIYWMEKLSFSWWNQEEKSWWIWTKLANYGKTNSLWFTVNWHNNFESVRKISFWLSFLCLSNLTSALMFRFKCPRDEILLHRIS